MAKKTRPRRPVKKARKAAPKKKLTKAQRVARLDARLFRASKRIADGDVTPDPFHIDRSVVPAGKAYQWHRYTTTSPDPIRDGWVPVPFDRHPGVFPKGYRSKDGWVVCEGLTLIENSTEWVKEELARSHRLAHELSEAIGGIKKPEGGRLYIMPEEWVEAVARPDAPPEIGPPIDVPISLLIRVPARWATAAAYLNLTLTEYARRRVVGERLVLGSLDLMDGSLEAVYEPVNLTFSPQKVA